MSSICLRTSLSENSRKTCVDLGGEQEVVAFCVHQGKGQDFLSALHLQWLCASLRDLRRPERLWGVEE